MDYKKGAEVLPARLLKEIQEYVEGSLVYIPKRSRKAGWGCVSGARQMLDKRNEKMASLYEQGESIRSISEQFHLGEDTVKKILYGKKPI